MLMLLCELTPHSALRRLEQAAPRFAWASAKLRVLVAGLGLALGTPALAQATSDQIIPLYAKGKMEALPVPEAAVDLLGDGDRWYQNVSEPSLTAVLPTPGKANGTAVIVVPGGGFFTLSWDNEGTRVAKRLADAGITAFVLKYRISQTPPGAEAFKAYFQTFLNQSRKTEATTNTAAPAQTASERLAADDATAAVRLIRSRAREWGVDPRRIGMVGFSAGAVTTANAAVGSSDGRPDFAGIIYGLVRGPVPTDAPPAFIATAADDPLTPANWAIAGYSAWRAAGRPVELHLYESGSHGFATKPSGKTSDHWTQEFLWWMGTHGLLGERQP
jgi:acetyl esterase/lipase